MKFVFNPLTGKLDYVASVPGDVGITLPLAANLGGTGVANAAGSTLTLGGATEITAKMATLTGETNVKGTFINDALTDAANPDMGYLQTSNLAGIYSDVITDKVLYNSRIGGSADSNDGQVKTSLGTFQVYLNERWNNIIVNFVLRENTSSGYTFEHQPVGFENYIEVMSGNSLNNLGLNGKPLTQGYVTSMGAYPVDPILDGGSF